MKARGFTLIEVMVALFVIALGVGALLTTLVSAADTVGYLRDRSFAQWIAFNRLSELRLGNSRPAIGTDRDQVEYAGVNWSLVQTVSEAGIGDLLRVDVRVARLESGEAAPMTSDTSDAEAPQASLGLAIGFIGPSLARASGISPDWSPRPPAGPGGGGDGGGGGGGGGDGGGDGDGGGGGDGDRQGGGGDGDGQGDGGGGERQ